MAIGMTYEQYWYGDPLMARAFFEADKLRQERENEIAWLHGAYFLRALDTIVGNIFRKTGSQLAEYPQKPIPLRKTGEDQIMDEEQEAVFAMAYMSSMVQAGKNWGKYK